MPLHNATSSQVKDPLIRHAMFTHVNLLLLRKSQQSHDSFQKPVVNDIGSTFFVILLEALAISIVSLSLLV